MTEDAKALTNPTFQFRPGEWRTYHPSKPTNLKPGEELRALMVLDTPGFPERGHPGCEGQILVCALKYLVPDPETQEVLWGWECLGAATKDAIYDDLKDSMVVPGKWFYMVVSPYKDEPHPDDIFSPERLDRWARNVGYVMKGEEV